MSDIERLTAALDAARTGPEIIEAVARAVWHNVHGDDECPDDAIPSEADLIEAIEADRPGIVEAQAEAAKRAAALGLIGPEGPPGTRHIPVDAWRWTDIYRDPREAMRAAMGGGEGDPDAILARLEAMGWFDPTRAPRLALAVFNDAGAGFALLLANVHQHWLATDGSPRHPLAPLVAAWLETRRHKVNPDTREDALMPHGLFPVVPAGGWRVTDMEHDALPLDPGPIADPDPQLILFGEDDDALSTPPLLMLANAAGFSALRQGRGARLDKRILLFGLLKMPREQRCSGGRWEVRERGECIVRELWAPSPETGSSSFRPGKHGRALEDGFSAVSLAKVRRPDGAWWRPGVTRQSPNPYNLDTEYIMEFRLPDDCDRGALVHRPSLIAAGMLSDPALDMCLSLAYRWDEAKARNGGFRIYAHRPKARRNGDGHLLDREDEVIMGAPGSPKTGKNGKPHWPAKGRDGSQVPMRDWRHPRAVIEGTERHPAADKVRAAGPDERRCMAFGDTNRRDRAQQSRDRATAERLLLALESAVKIVIEAPRARDGKPLSRSEWRILETPRPAKR